MNRTGQIILSALIRIFCVISVIACLCFSAGEGLRLTPLPVLPLAAINSSGSLVNIVNTTDSRGGPNYLGGPLDRPSQAQAQKRTKRPLLDCECPTTSGTGEVSFHSVQYLGASDQSDHVSHFCKTLPPGRAPPVIL